MNTPYMTFEDGVRLILRILIQDFEDDISESLKEQLNRIEKGIHMNTNSLQRLQADAVKQSQMLADMQQAMKDMGEAQAAAGARLEADIAALRNLIGQGGNNDAALAAVADSLESTQAGFQAVTDQLKVNTETAKGVDVFTISPTTATVARSTVQQFTTNDPKATFAAGSGAIDNTGLYTPSQDPAVTSDTVTATSSDGTQVATASVSITG